MPDRSSLRKTVGVPVREDAAIRQKRLDFASRNAISDPAELARRFAAAQDKGEV
jgi:hypothetical protein